MANGSVTIDIIANTKPAEKDINQFKNDIKTEDVKFDLVDESGIQNFTKQIEYLEVKAEDLKEKLRQIDLGKDGDVFKLEAELERTLNQRDRLKQKQMEGTGETKKNVEAEKQLGTEIDRNKEKQQGLINGQKEHSFHLGDIIKKVARWGMAIIGIRSAYMGIRRAISLVAGSNDAISQKMEQMRNVLIATITPIVEKIVNFLMKVMVYVNYITKALFGKAIFDFSKTTTTASKNMASTQKSASGTAKALKQASKQLAGFDEMNVLSDNKSSGGGGTSGVGGVGGLDTSGLKNAFKGLEDLKVPEWLDSVVRALTPVVEGWKTLIWAIGEEIRLQKIRKDNEAGLRADNKKRQKSLEKEGTQIIKNVKAGKQLTEQEFVYIRGIEDEIIKLTKKGKLNDAEKERLKILTNRYGDLYREGALNTSQMQLYNVITGRTKVSEEERLRVMGNLVDQSIEEYKASTNMADANEQVAQSTKDGKYWIDQYGVSLETIGKNAGLTKGQTDKLRDALNKFSKSDKGPKEFAEFSKTIEKIGKEAGLSDEEISNLIKSISGMKSKKVKVEVEQKTTFVSSFVTSGKELLKKQLKAIGWTDAQIKAMGLRKGGIIKYARGGIINQPGRGVPLAYGGEAGREGVIPLTDSQQMALLGEAIGKYITINANITNSMNGRIISRELQKIQNEQSFASNRW